MSDSTKLEKDLQKEQSKSTDQSKQIKNDSQSKQKNKEPEKEKIQKEQNKIQMLQNKQSNETLDNSQNDLEETEILNKKQNITKRLSGGNKQQKDSDDDQEEMDDNMKSQKKDDGKLKNKILQKLKDGQEALRVSVAQATGLPAKKQKQKMDEDTEEKKQMLQNEDVSIKQNDQTKSLKKEDKQIDDESGQEIKINKDQQEKISQSFLLKSNEKLQNLYQEAKQRLSSIQRPQLPKLEIKQMIMSRMPSISMPRIQIPTIPAINIQQYLPELPQIPQIPMPEPINNLFIQIKQFDDKFVSSLVKNFNYIIISLSIMSIVFGESLTSLLVFQPKYIVPVSKSESDQNGQQKNVFIPELWTFITSILIEEQIGCLFLNMFLLNYIAFKNKEFLEAQWNKKDFTIMILITAIFSVSTHFLIRFSFFLMFKNEDSYNQFRYSSINFIIIALILGLRQQANKKLPSIQVQTSISLSEFKSGVKKINFSSDPFSTKSAQLQQRVYFFDTGIPFISGNILIPYKILPQLFIISNLFIAFIFEQPINLRIILDFFFIWFYLRFFMKTKTGQQDANGKIIFEIGDLSQEFALHTFFPEKCQQLILNISEICFAIFNMCGLVNVLRKWLMGEPIFNYQLIQKSNDENQQKVNGKLRTPSTERKKAALEFLDEEISQLNKNQPAKALDKKKGSSQADKFADLQLKALLGGKIDDKKTGKTIKSDDSMSNDLDFNDLEIQFDDQQ